MVTRNPAVAAMGGYALEELRHRVAARRRTGETLWDFSIGDPDEPTPEFIRQTLIDAVGPVSSYPTTVGQADLRQAICDFFKTRHGVGWLNPDRHVLPTSGSKEAIFHLPFSVIDPAGTRRHVLWGDPGYPVYSRGTMLAGGLSDAVRLMPDNGWRLDLAKLSYERLSRACIVWLNYPHNPTGATVDLGWLRDQVAVARDHKLLLVSDECYQEVWSDHRPPSLMEAIGEDSTGLISIVSLSKRSGMTGYRSGAIVGDPAVIADQKMIRPNFGTASQTFVQAAAAVAWRDQDHVDARREVFAEKRRVVEARLREAGLQITPTDATFYVWFAVPGGDDIAYAERLLNAGIVASPGRSFGSGGVGWMRLALVPTVEDCHTAMARWPT